MRATAALLGSVAASLLSCATVRQQPSWATSRWLACEEWIAEHSCGYARRGPQRWVSQQGASWEPPARQNGFDQGLPLGVQGCLERHSTTYLDQPEPAKRRLLVELGCPKQIAYEGVTAEEAPP